MTANPGLDKPSLNPASQIKNTKGHVDQVGTESIDSGGAIAT